jgi:hypothetical protein
MEGNEIIGKRGGRLWLVQPILDSAAGLHCLELGGNVSNTTLDNLAEIHHGSLANELSVKIHQYDSKALSTYLAAV